MPKIKNWKKSKRTETWWNKTGKLAKVVFIKYVTKPRKYKKWQVMYGIENKYPMRLNSFDTHEKAYDYTIQWMKRNPNI